jgi:hypothetical protein
VLREGIVGKREKNDKLLMRAAFYSVVGTTQNDVITITCAAVL